MKKCPICESNFKQFEDIVEVENTYYHEDCLEIEPVKYCAYNPNEDDEDSFLGQFENDDKSWASDLLDEGDYMIEKLFKVSFTSVFANEKGKVETIETYAISEEDAKEKMDSPYRDILEVESVS
ncbi:hypothetical protein PMV48_19545 [Enterococcus avium]|uniref:hypothetical protein n=1 Tax=Enterococcus avium TaxID=33945 RepID=UPI00065F8A4F|nr:hypothetical protein [Enterococcus avium]MDB1725964.1 hypothetical protein [Enterococcus avium]HAQ8926893.1 hypothetical protein [Enterococcus faecium]